MVWVHSLEQFSLSSMLPIIGQQNGKRKERKLRWLEFFQWLIFKKCVSLYIFISLFLLFNFYCLRMTKIWFLSRRKSIKFYFILFYSEKLSNWVRRILELIDFAEFYFYIIKYKKLWFFWMFFFFHCYWPY